MTEISNTIIVVTAILLLTQIFKYITDNLHFQKIIFEILIGLIISSTFLSKYLSESYLPQLAFIGSLILLFTVGYKSNYHKLQKLYKDIFILGTGGVIIPFVIIFIFLLLLDAKIDSALFVAAATVSTSVGVTARILIESKKSSTKLGNIIIGASVLDDIYGLILLTFLLNFIEDDYSADFLKLALNISIFFLIVAALFFLKSFLRNKGQGRSYIISAISISLPFAAKTLGLAPITGAYFSGLLFSGIKVSKKMTKMCKGIYMFFVPLFFVYIGSQITIYDLTKFRVLLIGLALTVLIVIGQILAGLMLKRFVGTRSAIIIGFGMVPRGEVALVIASAGLSIGVISSDYFASILVMIVLSALIVPIIFSLFYSSKNR